MADEKKLNFVNLEYLKNMSGDDPAIIKEMIEVFIGQIPAFVTEMQDYYEKKDWTNLGLLAHKAKSSVAIMGMHDLADMLKDIEISAREGKSIEKYAGYIQRFINDTQNAVDELKGLY